MISREDKPEVDSVIETDDNILFTRRKPIISNDSQISHSEYKLSWANEVLREEAELIKLAESSSSKKKSNDKFQDKKQEDIYQESANSLCSGILNITKNEIERETSSEREMSIDFEDRINEKKFDKLVKENKLKTPFKRRHSNDDVANTDIQDKGDDYKRRRFERKGFTDSRRNSTSSIGKNGILETDIATLSRRQKQIDYGKNTIGYDRYVQLVPKHERTLEHPATPNKNLKYSRRAWDGLVKIWRKKLHYWDPSREADDSSEGEESEEKSDENDD